MKNIPYHPHLSPQRLFILNVSGLLHDRHASQRDLAVWCHHSEVWISKILKGEREAQMKDLGRIADFFGLAAYQLFQPGVTAASERRRGTDRRGGQDRRVSNQTRIMREVGAEIERARTSARSVKTPKPAKEMG